MDDETIILKVKRRDEPDGLSYWEKFEIPYEQGLTVAAALQSIVPYIREDSEAESVKISRPVFDCSCLEGSCGACAMIINGKPKLPCRTFVDDISGVIELEPLYGFSVRRDLVVDRSVMDDSVSDFGAYSQLNNFDVTSSCCCESQKRSRSQEFDGCIMCGICCENFLKTNNSSSISGAFMLARFAQLLLHPVTNRQAGDFLKNASRRGGVSDAFGFSLCEINCPVGIDLASAASVVGGKTFYCALADFFQKG